MNKRHAQGGTLPLIIVCTLVIVLIGVGFFFIAQLLGGEREFQNAVDSGNLNVAKKALVKPTSLPPGLAGVQFAGLGPTDDSIDLNTFNRTSAITLLVLANTKAMEASGSALGTTASNASMVQTAWETVGTSLATVLKEKNTFDSSNDFTNLANRNSVRMLTGKDNNSEHTDHTVSFSDRSALNSNATCSNVGFLNSQLPANPASGASLFVPINGQQYAKGYLSFDFAGAGSVFFVPLKQADSIDRFKNSQPHHISKNTFDTDKDTVAGWASPVPNSFLSKARTQEQRSQNQAILNSCAISQSLAPPLGFKAQIPRGFIRIVNGTCSAGGNLPSPPAGADLFSFLMGSPVKFGKPGGGGTLPGFYEADPSGKYPNLTAIAAANNAGKDPTPGNCNALHPAPSTAQCKQIGNLSATIDNTNAGALSPSQKVEIANAFNLVIPPTAAGTPIVGCLHAVERANQEFLAIRAQGVDHATLSSLKNFFVSGIANVNSARGSFPSCSAASDFSMTTPIHMADVIPSDSAIYAQLVQRCRQINPEFNGNLDSVIGWTDLAVPLGAKLFIYFEGAVDRATGQITGNLRLAANVPAFLNSVKDTPVDGTVMLHRTRTQAVGNGSGINHSDDCGYPNPYDFYRGAAAQMCVKDKIEYIPCTGFKGLLGEVDMSTCFGNNGCPAGTTTSEGAGPASTDCEVDANSFWEGPC